jgi:hypothetical protein
MKKENINDGPSLQMSITLSLIGIQSIDNAGRKFMLPARRAACYNAGLRYIWSRLYFGGLMSETSGNWPG